MGIAVRILYRPAAIRPIAACAGWLPAETAVRAAGACELAAATGPWTGTGRFIY